MTNEEKLFEKEAEDYSIDTYETCLYDNLPYVNDSRAREESFKDGANYGYKKANEWHYVKNGDLPKHEVNVLVLYNVQCIDIAHYDYDYKEWHFRDSIVRDVIAWCELPKLPKFEE